MEEVILRAKVILSALFKFDETLFEKKTRKQNVIEGRSFLIYFLRKDFGLTLQGILKYIPAITNHATIMHHLRKMDGLLKYEKETKNKYEKFLSRMLDNEKYVIETEIAKKVNERNQINNELTKLKKLL